MDSKKSSRFYEAVSSLTSTLSQDPVLMFRLAASVIFLLASVLVMLEWLLTDVTFVSLRPLMVLIGLSVIVLALSLNAAWVGILLSIAIAGTLIAPREFITQFAQIVTRSPQSEDSYRVVAQPQVENISNDQNESIELIEDLLGNVESGQRPQVRPLIDKAISTGSVQKLAEEVAVAGVIFPLEEIGSERRSSLLNSYGGEEFFVDDMRFLISHGLVESDHPEYSDARITELGLEVVEFLYGDDTLETNIPSLRSMDELSLREERTVFVSDPEWFRIEIDQQGTFQIDAENVKGDPTIALYDEDGRRLEDDDDSGGASLSARITSRLPVGTYAIELANYFSQEIGEYVLRVTVAE